MLKITLLPNLNQKDYISLANDIQTLFKNYTFLENTHVVNYNLVFINILDNFNFDIILNKITGTL